jgi:hypothetical protein
MDLGLPGSMQGGRMESISQQSLCGDGLQPLELQLFHSHHLPESTRSSKIPRKREPVESSIMSKSAPSVVGQPDMPPPALKPCKPKLKFTPEDDKLLINLKKNKSLTWKQIAEFFPGRSAGTLQVRYCTKLGDKTTQWTEETVSLSTSNKSRQGTY